MKVLTLLITYISSLDFTGAGLVRSVSPSGAGGSDHHVRMPETQHVVPAYREVYIRLYRGPVITAYVEPIEANPVPDWVMSPNNPSNDDRVVYIRNADTSRLTGVIIENREAIDSRNFQDYSCSVPLEENMLLTAFLEVINEPRHVTAKTSIYVRMPHDRRTYMGVLEQGDGELLKWMV